MLLAAVLAACSPSGHAGRRDTLRLAVTVEPSSLNPLLATTVDGSRLASLVFDPLLAVDERGRLQPALAAEVPTLANGGISHDGKRVTFHLRHGVRWQDGAPFTSADVAFTFAKVDDPAVNVGNRVGLDKIAKVATPDAWTVVATLTSAFAPILPDLSGYPIVPKHRLEHSADFNRDAFGQHPIGTGPYAFRHWDHGSRIAYDANPTTSSVRRRSRTSASPSCRTTIPRPWS